MPLFTPLRFSLCTHSVAAPRIEFPLILYRTELAKISEFVFGRQHLLNAVTNSLCLTGLLILVFPIASVFHAEDNAKNADALLI